MAKWACTLVRPTDASYLLGSQVLENSPVGTIVGKLNATDPDNHGPKGRWQNYTCSAINNAGGIFDVQNNVVKVS